MTSEQIVEPSVSTGELINQQLVRPVRVRLSSAQKRMIGEYLDDKYGHKCAVCGASERLERDHVNGDPNDNRLVNFRWLCKEHNLSLRGSASLSVCVPQESGHVESEMEKNLRTEPAWVEFISAQLVHGGLRKDLLTGMSALYVNISVATVNRHWKKYASPLGPFEIYRPNQGTCLLVRLRR